MATVLVVDDLMTDRRLIAELLKEDASLEVRHAGDGVDALESIAQGVPDLVVTDLMMPRMGGLDLVAAVRKRYPLVPVILMTSQGNEEIAVQALRHGAASYVPKRRLAQELLDIIRRVLAVSSRQRARTRLLGCLAQSNSTFVLRNDATLFEPLITYFQEGIAQVGRLDEAECTRVGVALAEALSNALYHGNLEVGSELRADDCDAYWATVRQRIAEPPYCERRIYVSATLSWEECRFVIQDEGAGFNPNGLPDATAPENLERPSGRGVLLMRTFMDEVHFNQVGNAVTLVKYCRLDGGGRAETQLGTTTA